MICEGQNNPPLFWVMFAIDNRSFLYCYQWLSEHTSCDLFVDLAIMVRLKTVEKLEKH